MPNSGISLYLHGFRSLSPSSSQVEQSQKFLAYPEYFIDRPNPYICSIPNANIRGSQTLSSEWNLVSKVCTLFSHAPKPIVDTAMAVFHLSAHRIILAGYLGFNRLIHEACGTNPNLRFSLPIPMVALSSRNVLLKYTNIHGISYLIA